MLFQVFFFLALPIQNTTLPQIIGNGRLEYHIYDFSESYDDGGSLRRFRTGNGFEIFKDYDFICNPDQDVSSYFEQRTRKIVETPLETEVVEEEEEDEDEIVVGTEDYGTTIQEFGFDEEQLESDWDERLQEAETELDDGTGRQ